MKRALLQKSVIENTIRKLMKDEDVSSVDMIKSLAHTLTFFIAAFNLKQEAILKKLDENPGIGIDLSLSMVLVMRIQMLHGDPDATQP